MSIKIALVGNPNCGKTTMFNAMTGANQYVGNWPGVTVEKKEGKLRGYPDAVVTDLPGIYSLSPYTLEEVVSRNYIIDEHPDVIVNLVDATNLERNLYLTTQVMEMGIPVVIALNMMDVVKKNGDKIDAVKMSNELGCPVVEVSALKGTGLKELFDKAVEVGNAKTYSGHQHKFAPAVEEALGKIEGLLEGKVPQAQLRWYAVKLFERDDKVQAKFDAAIVSSVGEITSACETALDDDSESIITNERYEYITSIIGKIYKKARQGMSVSDKIDQIVTNRILALPIFVVIMTLVYYIAVSSLGTIVTDWTNDTLFGEWIQPAVGAFLENAGAADWVVSLVVDGIIGGIGAPVGFAPQMAIVFFFLSILEDCGYMARVAFIMDRIFRRFGLSGKSFIPFLISSGCGVPGIMATRTIENEKDRRMTMMTTTAIPCGAKLPVIATIAGFLMGGAWWVAPLMYFAGIIVVIVSCIILKKTKMFSGDPAPFVMELPAYHWPTVGNVLRSTWERGWSFIKKAGTIILLSTIFVWFTTYFGWVDGTFQMLSEEQISNSILAKIGSAIAWIFIPLGWGNWQATVASITGLVAKENIVGTLGILYGGGDATVYQALGAAFTGITAYSFLVFNLLCAPCFAAIGAIKREMNSAKWTWFAIGYQCGFAYLIALMINQFGKLFTGNVSIIGLIFAIAALALIIYMLVRPYHESEHLSTKVRVK